MNKEVKIDLEVARRIISKTIELSGDSANNIPQIKLSPDSLLGSPQSGAFEYTGTNLYFTIGGVRYDVLLGGSPSTNLDSLTDVTIGSPLVAGQVLRYNGTYWENEDPGGNINGLTTGYIPYADSSTTLGDSNLLFGNLHTYLKEGTFLTGENVNSHLQLGDSGSDYIELNVGDVGDYTSGYYYADPTIIGMWGTNEETQVSCNDNKWVDIQAITKINFQSPSYHFRTGGNVLIENGTTFQYENGSSNGYILQSDASGNATWVDPTTLSVDIPDITNNVIAKGTGTSIQDGNWAFSGNDIYPLVNNSNIGLDGSPDFRIGTIYMNSNIDYLSDLIFKENGTERARFDGANFGIGNNNPLTKLHLTGNYRQDATGLTGNGAVYNLTAGDNNLSLFRINADGGGSNTGTVGLNLIMNNASGFSAALQLSNNSNSYALYSFKGHASIFDSSATLPGFDFHAGNNTVGIGRLSTSDTQLFIKGKGSTSATSALKVEDSSSNLNFYVRDDGAVNSRLGYWINGDKFLHFGGFHSSNTFAGVGSGAAIVSATTQNNTAYGRGALGQIVSSGSTTFGYFAGYGLVNQIGNFIFGNYQGDGSTGNYNVMMGSISGTGWSTENIIIGGATVGQNFTGGSYNVIIGGRAGAWTSGSYNFSVAIGPYSSVNASNQLTIGNQSGGGSITDVVIGYGPEQSTGFTGNVTYRTTHVSVGVTDQVNNYNFILAGGKGTGTGVGSSIIFQTSPAGTTGSTQNPYVEAARFTGAGRLVVGNTTALAKLDVYQNSFGGSNKIFVARSSGITAIDVLDTGHIGMKGVSADTNWSLSIGDSGSNIARFLASGTEALSIKSPTGGTGRLAINSSGIEKIVFNALPGTGTTASITSGGNTSATYALSIINSSSTPRFYIRDDGAISINTSTPATPYGSPADLTVGGSIGAFFNGQNTYFGHQATFIQYNSGTLRFINDNAGNIEFYLNGNTGATSRIFFRTIQNGQGTPYERLGIYNTGEIRIGEENGGSLRIEGFGNTGSTIPFQILNSDSDTSLIVRDDKRVGINTTSAVNTTLDVNGSFATRSTSPSQITSDQNDYSSDGTSVLRLNTDASRTITGFANGADGKHLTIINVGANNIVLSHQDGSSTAANQIILGNAASNITILPNDMVTLIYDGTSTRWRLHSKSF